MLCDDCQKRSAHVHVTQTIDGHQQEKWLCGECAKVYGDLALPSDKQFSFQDLLTGLLSHQYFNDPPSQELICSNCAMTHREFENNGKFGCSECYRSFMERLDPLLRRIHGASRHHGKLPRRTGVELEVTVRIQRLRQEQEWYIRREEYEEAARLRDEIKALESDLSEAGKGGARDDNQ